jgi:hypothetical protein
MAANSINRLTNGFPLLISLILLIFFKTFDVVIWYAAFLVSIGIFLAGAFLAWRGR